MDESIKYRLFDALCRRYESGQATAGSLVGDAKDLLAAAREVENFCTTSTAAGDSKPKTS